MINYKKNWIVVVFITSLIVITVALTAEYLFNILPCEMCYFQRYSYYFLIIMSGLYLLFSLPQNKIYYLLVEISLIIGLFFSLWHVGIENNVFNEFSGCTSNNSNIVNKDELLKALKETQPNCKDVTFKLLGFSLATINLFLSIIIIILSIKIIKNEKNR